MAGVGKLAKLLVKMGQKDLVRNFSKAPVKTSLKATGQALIWPFKKAHTLQGGSTKFLKDETQYSDLSKAEKLYLAGTVGSIIGLGGTCGVSMGSGNEELDEKMSNTTAMGLIGLLAGGPIGAVIGGTLGYFSTSTGKEEEAPAAEPEAAPTPESEPEAAAADSVATDSVPKPTVPPAQADSTATDSIPPATVPPVPRDSVAADSVPTPVVPPQPTDSVAAQDSIPAQATPPAAPAQPMTTEEKLAAQEERIKDLEKRVAELEGKTPTQGTEPPANNIFGGEINEISTKTLKVNIKGDCLWNIAKRELQKANPGKRITNAQILKQVKEFGRINPEIYGENPSLESLNNLQFGQELKLCA